MLSTIGFGGLVFGLIEGYKYGWWGQSDAFSVLGFTWPEDWPVSVVPVAFALAAASLAVFVVYEIRKERRGDMSGAFQFSLFSYPGFRWGNLAVTIVSLGEFGLLFVVPLFLQGVLGYSAFDTGLVLLGLAAGAFVAGPSAGMLASRIGPKWVVTAGMALEAAGIFWIGAVFSPDLGGWDLVPALVVYGVGVGLATAQLTNVALAQIPPDRSGVASGGTTTLRQVGTALGIAVLGTVLYIGLGQGTRDRLADVPQLPTAAVDGIAQAIEGSGGQALPQVLADPRLTDALRADIRNAVDDSFVEAGQTASHVATGFVLLGLVFSLLIPNARGEAEGAPG